MEQQAAIDPTGLESTEAEHAEFNKLNLHRIGRIRRTWRPSGELTSLLARIERPQFWMALTEPWCGDSAQCLPCLEILANSNPHLTIRYVLRDDNPGIMDNYLTGGKRSIPLLVAFDPDGDELFRWGPRPTEAQNVFDAATAEGLEKPAKLEKLHLFYGRNRGRALDGELVAVLSGYLDGVS
ncbi:MAG: thioredoxin family protein [Candidatus Krumholzibacteria bacterium]|nr:thioredoxin family protein [Candidatus Krumholzibacteria bacterium]